MGFADVYLLKAGLRGKLIETEPHPDLKIIVAIPAYNESGLERSLDSLFQCQLFHGQAEEQGPDGLRAEVIRAEVIRAEVIVLINAASDAPDAVNKQNVATYDSALRWISDHPHPFIDFHVLMDHSFERKEAGVGLARKILMDEAVSRFNSLGAEDGIIASMDADAVVQKNYLSALAEHFESVQPDGCSVYFEHPLSNDAIIQYELHLRYYLQSIRFTGYPHAFHTVGSSMAVKADVYCKEGGMNRRQAGEDFYFIQKMAQRGNFSECNKTCVVPSARPSDRVPFGTGAAVGRLVKSNKQLNTYNPMLFPMLKHLFSGLEGLEGLEGRESLEGLYAETGSDQFLRSQSEILLRFLESQQFGEALTEIRKNSASFPAFRKRFWRWFNMFRIMKFLHYARENGVADVPVGEAALYLLKNITPGENEIHPEISDLKQLLIIYRQHDRSAGFRIDQT